jgi:hypothetical protein
MMIRSFRCFLLAALLAGIPTASAGQAQLANGILQGRVLDATGASVAGASVEVSREASSFRRGTTADQEGGYRIAGLPAGRYRVRITRSGYQTGTGSFLLATGETLVYDWTVQIRPLVLDTVQAIAGSQTVISRSDTEFGTRLAEVALELLPSAHDPAELVGFTPGARAGQVWGGATSQANAYQIDGLAANHPGVGGDLIKPSVRWIESVEIRGLGAAAEHGNFQGGLININTKSGTNRFQSAFHVGTEAAVLTGSNLRAWDVSSEQRSRFDVEGEVRGPVVRNRLFYYLAGQHIRRDEQMVNHLHGRRTSFFHPDRIEWTEWKAFGKLLWQPTARDQLSLSGGYLGSVAERFGATGHETDAFLRMEAPSAFYQADFTHVFRPGTRLDVSAGGFQRDERQSPRDTSLPSVMAWGNTSALRPTFQNPAFRHRLAPSSHTVNGALSVELRTLGITHGLKVGAEYSAGGWTNERLRNGGLTWRPALPRTDTVFNPANPATWVRLSPVLPAEWGGEVNLHADVRNAAVFLQDHVDLGRRLSISPGVRWGWWEGYITPGGGVAPRFRAMRDARPEARLGLVLDVTGRNETVLKAHAGRYHQSMFAQFYERVEGGNVFNNQQLWYYNGPTPESPGATFTPAERDALARDGVFRFREEVRLNQTGPVDPGYRQPAVDQVVVGLEQQIGRWVKAEVVYVNRTNRNMVALVDRNAATNYTVFRQVRVFTESGDPLLVHGSQVFMPEVYIPNYAVVELLKAQARGELEIGRTVGPGLTPADTLRLTWNPDHVITNVPEARREFGQLQFVLRIGAPAWGGTVSVVRSSLRGNLDNVSGYEGSAAFGAGPFVNPNQAVNFFGELTNFSPWEMKVSLFGELGAGVRGGLHWNEAYGDRYTPHHELSGLRNRYRTARNESIHELLFFSVAGQPMFIGPRGAYGYRNRSTVDVRLERALRLPVGEWLFSLDGFNLFGRDTPLRINTSVNEGLNYLPAGIERERQFGEAPINPAEFFGTVLERERPRRIRIGGTYRF